MILAKAQTEGIEMALKEDLKPNFQGVKMSMKVKLRSDPLETCLRSSEVRKRELQADLMLLTVLVCAIQTLLTTLSRIIAAIRQTRIVHLQLEL